MATLFRVGDRVVPIDDIAREVVGYSNIGTVSEIMGDSNDPDIIRITWDKPKLDRNWDGFLGRYGAGFQPSRISLQQDANNKYYLVCRKVKEMEDRFKIKQLSSKDNKIIEDSYAVAA